MSSLYAVIRDSWSESNKDEFLVKSIKYLFHYPVYTGIPL